MNEWMDRLNGVPITSTEDALHSYAELHMGFISIHPFFDGNGRLARIVSNIPLLRHGMPPIMISAKNRMKYIENLARYQRLGKIFPDDSDMMPFVAFLKEEWKGTLEILEDARDRQRQRDARERLCLSC